MNHQQVKTKQFNEQVSFDNSTNQAAFAHGGDIYAASCRYDIAADQWLDLSTGLSPHSYPSRDIPAFTFEHLPYLQPQFLEAANIYYHSDQGLAINGSQMLIQNLPQCVANYPVLLPDVGYSEHRISWQQAKFQVVSYPALEKRLMCDFIDRALALNNRQHLVVINPNNPSGTLVEPAQLLKWAQQLADGCYLVVDEAFIDVIASQSVLSHPWPENMLILRSFGKFFGLAGIRIGFVFCRGQLRRRIERQLGLWMINGPAQYLAGKAMLDSAWQKSAIDLISQSAEHSQSLFKPLIEHLQRQQANGRIWRTHQALFSSYALPLVQAIKVQDYFAKSAILLRVIALNADSKLKSEEHTKENLFHRKDHQQTMSLLRIGIVAVKDRRAKNRIEQCIRSFIRDNSPHNEA